MTPDTYTLSEQQLDVGDGYQLYVQDWGNKAAAVPIIFLHGGPGGQSKNHHKGTFDPQKQRVIFFDQRGGGKSTPYGSLEHNTTADMVADISTIADHFGIDQFILVGGSWGSALALFYGIAHPERVKAMVLNGVWTSRKIENDWLDKGGFKTFFPETWDWYTKTVPAEFASDPSGYHFPRILGDNPEATKDSGYAYETLEGAAISLDDRFSPQSRETYDPTGIRIEVQYITNGCFMPDNYVFDNAATLTMPIWMVQGRYDMVCPPMTAYELSKVLPDAKLIWSISGHSASRESWNVLRTILLQLAVAR